MDFMKKLTDLEVLLKGIIVHNYQLSPSNKHAPEIDLVRFLHNQNNGFAGNYYDDTKNNRTFWIGYWERYGFCISFFDDSQNYFQNRIKSNNYSYHADYFKIDNGYWFTIVFKDQDNASNMIIEANKIILQIA